MPPGSLTFIIGVSIIIGILIGGILTTLFKLTFIQFGIGFILLCAIAVLVDYIYIKIKKIK